MPEGRQRTISKAGNRFKARANGTSECEEHGDEDDDSAINAFIEASCYNLRQLILSSVRQPDSHPPKVMVHQNCEGGKIPMESIPRRGGEGLVVVSVVLSKEQEDNDEVLLAIERLRKNGVTCAFFTMEEKHPNSKHETKLANGLISTMPQISDALHGHSRLLSVPVNDSDSPETIKSFSQSHLELYQTGLAAPTNEDVGKTANAKNHLKSHCGQEKVIAAVKKQLRKRKRRRTFGRRKLQNSKNRPDNIQGVKLSRKVHRSQKNGTNDKGLETKLSNGDGNSNSLKTEVDEVQGVPARVENVQIAADIVPKVSLESAPTPGGEPHNNQIESAKPQVGSSAASINRDLEGTSTVGRKLSPHTQTRSKTLIRQQKKAESFEESLAIFCLGDRATKSIATERIKRCLTEATTKKVARLSPSASSTHDSVSPLPNGVTPSSTPRSFQRVLVQTVEQGKSTSEKSENEGQSKRSERPNGSFVEMEDLFETPNLEKLFPGARRGECHFSKRRRRRVSMSPDIITLASPSTKPKLKFPEKAEARYVSSPATECISNHVASNSSETATESKIEILLASSAQQEEEKELAEIQEVLSNLVDQVVLQSQIDIATTSEQKGASTVDTNADLVTQDAFNADMRAEPGRVCGVAIADNIPRFPCSDDSLPDSDVMQLRRSSFYSLIAGNVRTNMENYLDGRNPDTADASSCKRRRRTVKNGFLLHHGDNCPEDPESPYKFHLATQVLLKLNKRRSKCSAKEERTKNVLSYLKLVPKRSVRIGKNQHSKAEETQKQKTEAEPTFSGDWTFPRKYICGVCSQVEHSFWDMVTHKGENHPGVVVTHVELPDTQTPPTSLIRPGPSSDEAEGAAAVASSLSCTKCHTAFTALSDLHRHIFECAGNSSWLVEKVPCKRKSRRRRGFKRRLSNTPKKPKKVETAKKASCQPLKCAFCSKEFKTEGWLKHHISSHSLPVSIPLDKLPLPPTRAYLRKCK